MQAIGYTRSGYYAEGVREQRNALVLVVDDDGKQAGLRAELLNRQGCSTFVAVTLDEALRALVDLQDVDLLLADINLSGTPNDRSGVLLAMAARERFPTLPIVGYCTISGVGALGEDDRRPFDLLLLKGMLEVQALDANLTKIAALAQGHAASRRSVFA
jgi:CheY-like chemotaxis protein